MQKETTRFIEGAAAGLAIGIAASIFFSSKTGKALRSEAKDMMGDFYSYMSPKLKKMEKLTREEYEKFVDTAAEQYGKAKKLTQEKVGEITKEAKSSWNHFLKQAKV